MIIVMVPEIGDQRVGSTEKRGRPMKPPRNDSNITETGRRVSKTA